MHDSAVKWLSRAHSGIYRVTGGRIGTRLVNNDMLLLTTTGRSTGSSHTVPLLYLTDGSDAIVIASYGGRPNDPDWYQNLLAGAKATIRIGSTSHAVRAVTMDDDERTEWWPRIVDAYSEYATYQDRTDRQIPVVRLTAIE